MALDLVEQLRFTRRKWLTGLEGLSEEDGIVRLERANSMSWMVGHLACFEQFTWLKLAQNREVSEAVLVCDFGKPATTPSLEVMVEEWHRVIDAAEPYLDRLTQADLLTHYTWPNGETFKDNIGTLLYRHTWHYWYHMGEVQAIRQALGHTDLPQFVGRIEDSIRYPGQGK